MYKTGVASLDAVRHKIDRAAEHLKALEGEAIRYFSGNPGDVVTEQEPHSGRLVLRFDARIPIPVSIPLIIGDALQNLRSSFDYLVWELVLAAHNTPDYKNMFPICDTHEAFKDQLRKHRLDGVSPEATTEIERLQPYNSGNPETTPVRVIDTFSNINKHRRLLITVLGARASRTEFISSESGYSIQSTLSPRYHGAEIAVGPVPTRPGETVEMKGNLIPFITFDEGPAKNIDVIRYLNQQWHFVNDVAIPKFERFF